MIVEDGGLLFTFRTSNGGNVTQRKVANKNAASELPAALKGDEACGLTEPVRYS